RGVRLVRRFHFPRDAVGARPGDSGLSLRRPQGGGRVRSRHLAGDVARGHPDPAAPAPGDHYALAGAAGGTFPVRRPADCGVGEQRSRRFVNFDLDLAMEVLERTPATIRALLNGLSEPWVRATEGPDTFSPFDVVGHLIDGEETDWIPRARIILAQGPSIRFEPYDRFRHK